MIIIYASSIREVPEELCRVWVGEGLRRKNRGGEEEEGDGGEGRKGREERGGRGEGEEGRRVGGVGLATFKARRHWSEGRAVVVSLWWCCLMQAAAVFTSIPRSSRPLLLLLLLCFASRGLVPLRPWNKEISRFHCRFQWSIEFIGWTGVESRTLKGKFPRSIQVSGVQTRCCHWFVFGQQGKVEEAAAAAVSAFQAYRWHRPLNHLIVCPLFSMVLCAA